MLFDGLSPIVCGVLGYVSIILYDLNNTSHNNDRMQSLHTVGAGLIGLAFFSTVLPGLSEANSLPTAVRVIAGILALGFFALLIYLTLIAGGRTNWKRKDPKKRWWEKDLVTTGVYALCRHPSVWAMLFFCLLLIPAANFDPWCATTFSHLLMGRCCGHISSHWPHSIQSLAFPNCFDRWPYSMSCAVHALLESSCISVL